ncbi:MAG: acyltransferase family protein [Myxococcales bacterium]|nr:acyltransferase family protein [Myxococcales bacterium]MCB9644763.1 acyltransferase family protein [Myxococcales bacterium]
MEVGCKHDFTRERRAEERAVSFLIFDDVAERVERLDIPFNQYGYDTFGVSKQHLKYFYSMLTFIYRHYLTVTVEGIENVPAKGRCMVVGNHSGGIALDGGMVVNSMLLEREQPRLVHGMADKFLNSIPFTSMWLNRVGQLTGLPEHAVRLLESDRVLMVFPEGARGTAKLYKEQFSLVRFGTGFMRLALQTGSPIVPFAFIGGGDAIPTIRNLKTVGSLVGVPYVPVTPYLLPLPRPGVHCHILYAEPMYFEGTGSEEDEIIEGYVKQVKEKIGELIEQGRKTRDTAVAIRQGRKVEFEEEGR